MLKQALDLFLQCRGASDLPDRFLSLDTEFTGFRKNDLIYEFGWCWFEGGKAVKQQSVLLNWLNAHDLGVVPQWFKQRMYSLTTQLKEQGLPEPPTLQFISQFGKHPTVGYEWFLEELEKAKAERLPIVGHGLIKVDAPRIVSQFEEYIGALFRFIPEDAIDTMALEKLQLLEKTPLENETFFQFQTRVLNAWAPKGCKFNLTHCLEKYELERKYEGIIRRLLHAAEHDAYIGGCLFEEQKKLYHLPVRV